MSNIVEFRTAATPREPSPSVVQLGRPAQIVIFPGVRYERVAYPGPVEPDTRTGSRSRKKGRRSRK